jgi:O-acetyl-ADP-ribose deacetylase (regulator of RNase III)
MADHSEPTVEILQGDITRIEADAIVNAANEALAMGGGVCGAIFRAAGADQLAAACRVVGRCPTGSAVATPAFGITRARHIIHAVGPVHAAHRPDEARRLLRSAYSQSIALAARLGCSSIAFPAISTGIYGYPLDEACREAVDVCVTEGKRAGLRVKLVAFDAETAKLLRACANVPGTY